MFRQGDVGARATCTTCQMAEDFSNYWVAHMYFRDPKNGTYHRVMPAPVQPLLGGSNGAQGGLTVYYTQFDLSKDNLKQQPIKTFPPVIIPSSIISKTALDSDMYYFTGLPHDRWQPNSNRKAACWSELPMHPGRKPRYPGFPVSHHEVQRRYLHDAPLPSVSHVFQSTPELHANTGN